jgi:AcrR family transcriptional regulator
MRVVKLHEVRRAELLDAAWELFQERGYEATTVTAIIQKIDVAKGTFYHYFSSKAELLDAVVDRVNRQVFEGLLPALEDPDLGAVEKLSAFLAARRSWRVQHHETAREIFVSFLQDDHAVMWHRLNRRSLAFTIPAIERVITQGVEEGVFAVDSPGVAAELILGMRKAFGEQTYSRVSAMDDQNAADAFLRLRFEAFLTAVERILGATPDSLERPSAEFFATTATFAQGPR